MSKMDGLRAMREARYAEATKAAKPAAGAKSKTKAATKTAEAVPPPSPESTDAALCGHRAISGRTCTREHGHEAKSHRYS